MAVLSETEQSIVPQILLAGATIIAISIAALALIRQSTAADHGPLEDRIEMLEDLRWQAQDNAHHLQALLDGQADVILQRDAAGKINFVNRSFCKKFGLSLEAVVGKPFHPAVIEREEALGPMAETPDLPVWASPSVECIKTDAGPRWIEWTHYSLPEAEPDVGFVQTVGRDITTQRRNERALARARDEARAADRAKSRFLASMSHEIRTPMNGIMGMTGLLSETTQSPEQRTYTEAVRKSATTLLSLIDEILDFSKIEAGHLELSEGPIDIIECVQGVIELLAPSAYQKDLQLVWSLSPDMPRNYVGDETRLRQILLNLIGNAVKFTDTGGVSTWVGMEPDDEAHDTIKVVVRDTGPGLSEEERGRIFREFERAVSRKATHEGTGLGLAIARRLASSMGGDIRVCSQPGHGATFTLSVRLRRRDDVSVAVDEAIKSEMLTARRVALVSTRSLERRTLANFLRSHNLAVVEAATVADLKSMFADASFGDVDTVLFDSDVCPDEARSLLEALKISGNVAAAVMGGADKRSTFTRFHQAGVERFLVRPIRPATLLALLAGDVDRATTKMVDQSAADIGDDGPAATETPTQRILVAEDNEINALLARTILTRLGCEAVVVPNGREAIKAVSQALEEDPARFDVILMDLHMPEVDGLEATAEIRRLYRDADALIPAIVAVTANAFQEDRQRCLAAGMDDYLSKPFEPGDLKQVLERVQRRKAPETGNQASASTH